MIEYPPLGTIGICSPEPLRPKTLQHYYNENKDIGGFPDQNMLQGIFRPAKPVNIAVHKEVRFVGAPVGASLV
jgi:hypothetical protein